MLIHVSTVPTIALKFGLSVGSWIIPLPKTAAGRCFISVYYALSFRVVKWFGDTTWFKKIWRSVLDAMVYRLNDAGVEDTVYVDHVWK